MRGTLGWVDTYNDTLLQEPLWQVAAHDEKADPVDADSSGTGEPAC